MLLWSCDENLYSSHEFSQILRKYNQLFNVFRVRFWYDIKSDFWISSDDSIVDIKRWIIWNSKNVFWDYLWATHGTVKNLIDLSSNNQDYRCRCIEFKFWSWKSMLLATNIQPSQCPKWISCLDAYYMKLNKYERSEFDRILLSINQLEYSHFHSEKYEDMIKKTSKEKLFEILSFKES